MPEKNEEVVGLLKACGAATTKGTFHKVERKVKDVEREEKAGLWSQVARLFTRKKRTEQEKNQERSLVAAESQDYLTPSKKK